ncbi:molybdopterin-dependent oxidoreductase [Adlercreutzia sp. ZJ242]|uniref:molybdopterin-dependent oxidoreductase n=1 Tax=Adlercreutzia sp. ZJ242 TaxID=2709409 RepID=UPI0013ECAF44|nr:molybdopterin-dependent oxidoreductase [Adlercreutzia sp. ZJ242]
MSFIADKTVYKSMGFCGVGDGANIANVDVKDGKVVRIRPVHYDELYTKEDLNYWTIKARGSQFEPGMKSLLPPLSLTYKNRIYSKNRVPYPLKRVDWDPNGERHPETRGESRYERISWDEALDIVADEIKRIHDAYGPASILCQGGGHAETKNATGTHGVQTAMFNTLGTGCVVQARNADSWEGWYWGGKYVWGNDPVGEQVQLTNVLKDIAENSDAVLHWGCDLETTPWGWGGQLSSRTAYWFTEIGIKQIFICPELNYSAAIHADKWIPVLPNTDAALQLAIAYVWMTEGTFDREYLETHTVGYDHLERYVLGEEDGVPKTPKWAEEKCHVPSYTIKALARYWAKHSVSIGHGNGGGYIRSCFSHEPARLEICLLAMQGVGKPGANQFKFLEKSLFYDPTVNPYPRSEVIPSTFACFKGALLDEQMLGKNFVPQTLIPNAIGGEKFDWYGHTMCTFGISDQLKPFQFPNPGNQPIHMVWSTGPCWQTCWNGGFRFQDVIRSEAVECYIVQHQWMENDTNFADLILPVTTKVEEYDLNNDIESGQFNMMYLEEPAIEPFCDARSDYAIVCGVAKSLERFGGIYAGLHDKITEGLTDEELLKRGYEMSGIPLDQMPWEKFKQQKLWISPTVKGWEDEPAGLIGFYEDPESHPFSTPSGKIEIYSTLIADNFPDDAERGPVPHWVEESPLHHERITSDRAQEYPYLLMSNHPRWRVHAQHDDCIWLREIQTCKVVGPDGYAYEPIWINPADAAEKGLKNGDVAELFNERGRVLGGIIVTERIMPGALYQDHGARVDTIVPGTGGLDRGGANNMICPSATTSKNCAGEVTNSFLVGIRKVDVFELAEQYAEAFGREYDPACGLVASARIEKE